MFLSREGRHLGVAFQDPPGCQSSSRGEAKDSAGSGGPEMTGVCLSISVSSRLMLRALSRDAGRSMQGGATEGLGLTTKSRPWQQEGRTGSWRWLDPIFPSGCEGKLGVALESLQGQRDLI